MNRADMRAEIKIELGDDAGTVWSDNELNRCVDEVTADISRLMPRELVTEIILVRTVTSESVTSSDDAAVALKNKPIKPGSETVKNSAGTVTYTIYTDYEMDYINGKITTLSDGAIPNATTIKVTYEKSSIGFDISGLTDFISPTMLEFVQASPPQQFDSFITFGDFLYVTTRDGRTQAPIPDESNVRLYYEAHHVAPSDSGDASFPRYLDEVTIKGSVAYALFIKHRKENLSGVTDIGSGGTALTNAGTSLTNAGTSLTKITTALDKLSAAGDVYAKVDAALAKIITALDKLSTATTGVYDRTDTALAKIITALDKLSTASSGPYDKITTALDKVDTHLAGATLSTKAALANIDTIMKEIHNISANTGDIKDARDVWADEVKHILTAAGIPNAEDFLETGDDLIDKINLGTDAGELYRRYAETALRIAELWADKRKDYLVISQRHIDQSTSYIQEARERATIAQGFINEANQWSAKGQILLDEASRWLGEARGWSDKGDLLLAEAAQWLSEAQGWLNKGQVLINEAVRWSDQGNGYIQQADRYMSQARHYFDSAQQRGLVADRFLTDARERHTDYWAILKDRIAQGSKRSMAATRQYPVLEETLGVLVPTGPD